MKKVVKWIFIVILFIILVIDMYGFWKHKLNGTKYVTSASSDTSDSAEESDSEQNENIKIEYSELKSTDFTNGEKLFITDIEAEEKNMYTIKGLIYEEYEITQQEYNDLKNGKSSIEIFNIEYTKDKIQSNNLKLKSSDENAESFYIKYNSSTKKYILKDSTTDNSVYKPTEDYVKTTVSEKLSFIIQKNKKTQNLTVKDVAKDHIKLQPPKDTVKINYSTIEFSKKGEITKITELNV